MADYMVRSTKVTHSGVLSNVRIDEVVMPGGSAAEREVVEHANAVAVVALEPDGRVVLLRHYRHAIGHRQIEIPAGKLDVDGEEPMAAARRELLEEVGLAADELEPLIHFYNSAGWTDEATTVYFCDQVRPHAADAAFVAEDEEADLEIIRMTLDEAVDRIVAGEIRDAKTVIGLLLAQRRVLAEERP
jgi:ADP-ribose pyrophosphatase